MPKGKGQQSCLITPRLHTARTRRVQFLPGVLLLLVVWCSSFVSKLLGIRHLTASQLTDPYRMVPSIGWGVIFIVLTIVVVVVVEGCPLSSIGLHRMTARDALWAVGFYVAATTIGYSLLPIISALGLPFNNVRTEDLPPLLDWTSIVTAAVSEELLYRGYLIERITALTGSTGTAAFFSWTFFSAMHLPLWGMQGVLNAAVFGAVITSFYLWRRNLSACMLTHALFDAAGGKDMLFGFGPLIWHNYVGFGVYFRVFR